METIIQNIAAAASWTFLHSIWQGIILSVIGGAIIYFVPTTKAKLRYNLLIFAISVFFVTSIFTFFKCLEIPQNIMINEVDSQNIDNNQSAIIFSKISEKESFINIVLNYINNHTIEIFLLWFLIFIYKFIKVFYGLIFIKKLKKSGKRLENIAVLEKLKSALNIKKSIEVYETILIKAPAIAGHFKPIIFLPLGFFNQMSPQDAEAVLLHELAHIQRSDYLINILLSIIDSIYFFNPALLWVSNLTKEERENCCDDMALQVHKDKTSFVKALIYWYEQEQYNHNYALNFNGGKMPMLTRINRIFFNNNKTLNNMDKKFLSASIIFGMVCLFAFISVTAQKNDERIKMISQSFQEKTLEPINPELKQDTKIASNNTLISRFTNELTDDRKLDSVPVYRIGENTNMTGETNTIVDGKKYRILIKNSYVTDLYIDGEKIPTNKIIDYETTIDQIHQKMITNSNEQANRDREQAMRDKEQAEKDAEQAIMDREQAMRDKEQAIRDREQAMLDKAQAQRDKRQARSDKEQAIRDREQAQKDREQAIKDREEAEKDRQTMNKIIDDLIANNIIKHREELTSLKFNANELVVNGIKQSTILHKKLKDKYVTSSTWSWGITHNNE